jgi:DNA-binding NarL/FixJ family response regulator
MGEGQATDTVDAGAMSHATDRAMRVFVVCETRLYREGLMEMLKREGGVDLAGSADGLNGWLEELRHRSPDLALVDVTVEGGLGRIGTAAELRTCGVVAFGADSPATVVGCAEAGAIGCVSRHASPREIVEALAIAARQEVGGSASIIAILMSQVRALAAERTPEGQEAPLTAREIEILSLIEQGLSNKEIAGQLFIAVPTVKNHIHNLLGKLNLSGRLEAALWFRKHASPFSAV